MEITIIIPSNRPALLRRFLSSTNNLGGLRKNIIIHISAQCPNSMDDMIRLRDDGLIDSFSMHKPSNPTNMVLWRRRGMELNKNSDYYWFLDDDHQFSDAKKDSRYYKTCEQYYTEVFYYLENNKDVGVMCCNGYFGGFSWGFEIKKNQKNGLLSTDKGGMIIRNIGIESICPFDLVGNKGALFESVFGYNVMDNGYNFARRFNCPTKSEAVGASKRIGTSNVLTYSNDVVDKNNNKYIREKFNDPDWNHSSKKYPRKIANRLGFF